MKPDIPWKRYWHKVRTEVRTHNGLLIDPENNPGLAELLSWDSHKALFLYGEAGIGKSTEVKKEVERLKQQGYDVSHIDLGDIADRGHLEEKFPESAEYLFLDSYDEARIGLPQLDGLLIDLLQDREEIKFRIVSRSAVRPWRITQAMPHHAPVELELAPLMARDIVEAAEEDHIDGWDFLEKLAHSSLAQFAAKPKTLAWLLDEFKRGGDFADTLSELYEEACLQECHEGNPVRRERGYGGEKDEVSRLELASLIAAASLLCDKQGITDEGARTTWLRKTDFLGKKIRVNDADIVVDATLFAETLRTPLFVSKPDDGGVRGWEHRSTAEYLAARFLRKKGLKLIQLKELFEDSSGMVRPQLSGTAGWLAGSSDEFLEYCLERDPRVLLSGDTFELSEAKKQKLFKKLVAVYSNGVLGELFSDRAQLTKIGYPGLLDDIRSILNSEKSPRARASAIQIGDANKVAPAEELVSIVADLKEEFYIRRIAAKALQHAALTSDLGAILKRVLFGNLAEDNQDDLKAQLIIVLFPKFLNQEELFAALTCPKDDHYLGTYCGSMENHILQNLDSGDLASGIDWIEPFFADLEWPAFEHIADRVIALGLRAAEKDRTTFDALARLARTLGVSNKRYHWHHAYRKGEEAQREWQDNSQVRRLLLDAIFHDCESDYIALYNFPFQPLLTDDLDYFLDGFEHSTGNQKKALAGVLSSFGGKSYSEGQKARLRGMASGLSGFQFLEENHPPENPSTPTPQEEYWEQEDAKTLASLREALNLSDREIHKKFATLSWLLNKGSSDNSGLFGHQWDQTNRLMWRSLSPEEQEVVARVARQFLFDLPAPEQPNSDSILAYRAMLLLSHFPNDESKLFSKWALSTIVYDTSNDSLADRALKSDPNNFVRALSTAIRHEDWDSGEVHCLSVIRHLYCEDIEQALILELNSESLKNGSVFCLLAYLLSNGSSQGFLWAKEHLSDSVADENLRAEIACALLMNPTTEVWDIVRPQLDENHALATKTLEKISLRCEHQILEGFTPQQLEDYFFFVAKESGPDIRYDVEIQFSEIKSSILETLASLKAVDSLERISAQFPESYTPQTFLARTELVLRTSEWQPPSIVQLFKLFNNEKSHYVESEKQLLELVVESLGRFNADLHGETPAVRDLWNESPIIKPKHEDTLSDQIKRHLQRDIKGVIVNREVEIRKGQEADVHVNAKRRGDSLLKVIVEAKGDWNAGLFESLKDQLIDRYLKDNPGAAGIYFVGRYFCSEWDDSDYNNKQAASRNQSRIDELVESGKSREGWTPLVKVFVADCTYLKKAIKKQGPSKKAAKRRRSGSPP